MEHIQKMTMATHANDDAMNLIDNYTLLVLSPEDTPEGHNATKISVLFAQLASNAKHNRFMMPIEWANNFTQVLAHIGWTSSAFNMDLQKNNAPTVMTNLINETIAHSSTTHAAAVKNAMNLLTTKRQELFFKNSMFENRALVVIASTAKHGDTMEMLYCMLFFEGVAGLKLGDNFLSNEWQPYQVASIRIGVTKTTLNNEQYKSVQQTLRDKLLAALLPYEQL